MRYLFIHQTAPGQFPHLARKLAENPSNQVYFLSRHKPGATGRVTNVRYRLRPRTRTHPFLQNLQNGVLHGEAVARAILDLEKHHRFRPDLIYAHPGWGETLFVKDVLPDVPLVHYCEFFYHTLGTDLFFGPDETPTFADFAKIRTKNAVNLMSLDICDYAVTPTQWQWRLQPPAYRPRISVIHDGIDCDRVVPDTTAQLMLPDGSTVGFGDEIVTYVNRSMEPFRGLFTFADAAKIVAKRRPDCRFLVIGRESGQYYGRSPPQGETYRGMALERLGDARRQVIFLGSLSYDQYLRVLSVSAAHVYLTRPFVLSWSMLEAMSTGCVVIGSATPPVAEVIEDDENGLLVDFFSAEELAERIEEAIADKERMRKIRLAARQTIVARYSLARCLPAQLDLIGRALRAGTDADSALLAQQRELSDPAS